MNPNTDFDDMRPEYDFSGAVRGKHFKSYREGTNVILLDSDVAQVFRDSESVNNALRALMHASKQIKENPPKKST